MASGSSGREYPIWLADDTAKLENFLVQIHNQKDRSRLTQEIAGIRNRSTDGLLQGAGPNVPVDPIRIIIPSIPPHQRFQVLSNQDDTHHSTALGWYINWGRNDIVDLIMYSLTVDDSVTSL